MSQQEPIHQQRIGDFLKQLSSRTPTPGGGSAVAVSGAYGTGLLLMACRYSNTEPSGPMDRVTTVLQEQSQRLLDLAERDRETYDEYRTALDRDEDPEEIRRLLVESTRIPLDVGSACEAVLRGYREVQEQLKPSFQTDVKAALKLIRIAWETADDLASYNLEQLPDGTRRRSLEEELQKKRNAIEQLLNDQ